MRSSWARVARFSFDDDGRRSASEHDPHAVRTTGISDRTRQGHELKLRIASMRVKTCIRRTNERLQLVCLAYETICQIANDFERLWLFEPVFRN